MPRLLLGIFVLLLASVTNLRAQGDVALLIVGTDTVGLKEFDYHFKASSEKDAHVFAQTYSRFKQKVLWARELGMDTLSSHVRQKEYFMQAWFRREALGERNRQGADVETEWIKLIHVTRPLSQHASRKEERKALVYMDSLYAALDGKEHVPFETLPWIQTRHLLKEWKEQLSRLKKGEYSKPFYSPLGIHLLAWTDRRLERWSDEEPSEEHADFRKKEMEEGLLVAALEDYLEKTIVCSESDLEGYFDTHKEEYGWGTPHYQGAVIHCQDKKEAKRIRKYLKKYPMELWQDAWKRMPADVSSGCLMETGLFAIGTNPYIDKLVFKCGEFQPKGDYPYAWVVGKKMKKGPASYHDVSGKVEKDCRMAKKKNETEAFLQKYQVEINEEVLKTVNRCGNK